MGVQQSRTKQNISLSNCRPALTPEVIPHYNQGALAVHQGHAANDTTLQQPSAAVGCSGQQDVQLAFRPPAEHYDYLRSPVEHDDHLRPPVEHDDHRRPPAENYDHQRPPSLRLWHPDYKRILTEGPTPTTTTTQQFECISDDKLQTENAWSSARGQHQHLKDKKEGRGNSLFTDADEVQGVQHEVHEAEQAATTTTCCINHQDPQRMECRQDVAIRIGKEAITPVVGNGISPAIISLSPFIVLAENFLEREMCEGLIELALPFLRRSKVASGTETPNRTSSDCFFAGKAAEHPLLKEVEHRLQQLLHMPQICRGRKQLVQSEAIQVVRYLKGEFYQEHYDNKETPPGIPMKRSATAILYLNTTAEGGATFFPRASGLLPLMSDEKALLPGHQLDCHNSFNNTLQPSLMGNNSFGRRHLPDEAMLEESESETPSSTPAPIAPATSSISRSVHADNKACPRPGIKISPLLGRVVLFWSSLPEGSEDLFSLHSAQTVLDGEKWIATCWFKDLD